VVVVDVVPVVRVLVVLVVAVPVEVTERQTLAVVVVVP
jgi:hypothetical protein